MNEREIQKIVAEMRRFLNTVSQKIERESEVKIEKGSADDGVGLHCDVCLNDKSFKEILWILARTENGEIDNNESVWTICRGCLLKAINE